MLTIYTPVFNASKYISLTIQSVLNQTFSDWEYLIYDDGSTDNTKDIVHKFIEKDKRIKYKYFENTANPALLRNYALKDGLGEWFANLDADDIWHPLRLEIQFNIISKSNLNSIVFSKCKFFKNPPSELNIDELYEYLEISKITDTANVSYKKISNSSLLNGNYIMNSSSLVSKKVYNEIGLLDDNINLRGIEDFEFWLRAACNEFELYEVQECLAFWRQHDGNISNERPYEKEQNIVDMIKKAKKCKDMKIEKKFAHYYMMSFLNFSIKRKMVQEKKSLGRILKFIYARIDFTIFIILNKLSIFN